MAIKGRHNRITAHQEVNGLALEAEAQATRRDLFSTHAQFGNWVLAYVAPDRIDPNPNQPRRQVERAALEELKQSIASRGILQPLLGVKANQSRVQLVAGHRRLQAAKELGLPRVPVVLVDRLNEEDTVIDAVIENIQRRNLEAWEEGVAYAQLADEFGWTHDEIGRKIGKSRSYVSTRVRAAEKLSPLVKEVLATGNWGVLNPTTADGTFVPASEKNHNQADKDGGLENFETEEFLAGVPQSAAPLNNVEVIRRLTALSREQQDDLVQKVGRQINTQAKLSVRDIIELIKASREGDDQPADLKVANGYQLSFVDLGLNELDLFHQWAGSQPGQPQTLSVGEIDRLIDLYERDLSKLRQVRARREEGRSQESGIG